MKKSILSPVLITTLFALLLMCSACLFKTPSVSTPISTKGSIDGEIEYGIAPVNKVEIIYPEKKDESVLIVFSGVFPDDCTHISEIMQENQNEKYVFTVNTIRPKNETCNQVETPFEESLPFDEYTESTQESIEIEVNGVNIIAEIVTSDNEAQNVETPITCPQPSEGFALYTDDFEGFCFLFPDSYTVSASTGDYVVLTGDSFITGEDEDQLLISLMIEIVTVNKGDTSEDLANSLINTDAYTKESVNLDAEPLLVFHDIQDITYVRKGFAVHYESGYVLTLIPEDNTLPDQSAIAENLWESVIDSWVFLYN